MNNKSEQLKALRQKLEELESIDSNSLSDDELSQLLFRMNNIGYSLKRIADSLGDIKRMMIADREDRV